MEGLGPVSAYVSVQPLEGFFRHRPVEDVGYVPEFGFQAVARFLGYPNFTHLLVAHQLLPAGRRRDSDLHRLGSLWSRSPSAYRGSNHQEYGSGGNPSASPVPKMRCFHGCVTSRWISTCSPQGSRSGWGAGRDPWTRRR